MSIATEIKDAFPDQVTVVGVNRGAMVHGESATRVNVRLTDGREIIATFTNESKPGFGGVIFANQKDVVGLMTAKIKSVLEGTSEGG